MVRKPFVAVLLSLLMFSGCFGEAEPESPVVEQQPVVVPYDLSASWDKVSPAGEIDEISELNILIETTGDGTYSVDSKITLNEQPISNSEYSVTAKATHISIVLLPSVPGTYEIEVIIQPSQGADTVLKNSVQVLVPNEGTTSLVVPQFLVAESSMLPLQGQILHASLETCSGTIEVLSLIHI